MELIKVETSGYVNARALHDFLQSGQKFTDWINNRIRDYDFQEGKDFFLDLGKTLNGRPRKEYMITINMAKELCMVERTDLGKQARAYFITCEERLKNQAQVAATALPQNYLEALKQLVVATEQKEALQLENNQLKPKAKEFEQVFDVLNMWTMTQAITKCGLVGVSAIKLNQYFKSLGFIYKNGGHWTTTVKGASSGLFTFKESKNNNDLSFRTLCLNNKGLDYLYNHKEAVENYRNLEAC